MHAHTDLAKRVGYPPELFDVTGEASLERSLRAIAGEDTRRCLLHAANRGGELSSPQVSPGLLLSWLLLLLLLLLLMLPLLCIDATLAAHVAGVRARVARLNLRRAHSVLRGPALLVDGRGARGGVGGAPVGMALPSCGEAPTDMG